MEQKVAYHFEVGEVLEEDKFVVWWFTRCWQWNTRETYELSE